MLGNYLVVAIRNLLRNKLYTFINVFGLALGIACCLLMALFVKHEWSYDRFHDRRDRIYRLVAREVNPKGNVRLRSLHSPSMVEPLASTFPGIVRATGFMASWATITAGDLSLGNRHFGEVQTDFLRMFGFPLVAGDAETALGRPDGVVISRQVASQFLGPLSPDCGNVLGQTVTFHGFKDETFVVTGVMEPVPENSSLQFDLLIPISHWENYGRNQEGRGVSSIYVQLREDQNPHELEAAWPAFIRAQEPDLADAVRGARDDLTLYLEPLTQVYWNALSQNAYEEKGNAFAAYLLSGIAVLVLVIACSNFVTLSIGRSTGRAREVGMRKVLGACRKQLMYQFWGEAFLLSLVSLLLGLLLAELLLPAFNGLVLKQLRPMTMVDWHLVLIAMGLTLSVGLFAGCYPALVLSRWQPVESLKGRVRIGGRSRLMRGLVVFEYAASIALMVCTGLIAKQQHYIETKDMGYNREHVVVVRMRPPNLDDSGVKEVAERYKRAVLGLAQVVSATVSDRSLAFGSRNADYTKRDGSRILLRFQYIDADYVPTMGLALVDGRNFRADSETDLTQAILVNEALVKALGLTHPVGTQLSGKVGGKRAYLQDPTIIGVVRDFHTGPLYETIPPLVMQRSYMWNYPTVLVRIRPGEVSRTVQSLKGVQQQVAPGWSFSTSFLDECLDRQYLSEQRWERVLGYSASFAIAISCLGLFGLATLAVARRTREIGIRKALGATVPGLLRLLSGDFVKLLALANLIAWPLAYYAMQAWLSRFAYRTNMGPEVFVLSGLLALAIAVATVSLQTIRPALASPVETFRYE